MVVEVEVLVDSLHTNILMYEKYRKQIYIGNKERTQDVLITAKYSSQLHTLSYTATTIKPTIFSFSQPKLTFIVLNT